MSDDPLYNYRQLIKKIDALCGSIAEQLGEHITCKRGCSSCCSSITLFPVEAAAMRLAAESLPQSQSEDLHKQLAGSDDTDDCCPLLADHECLLYHARPVICRTHGIPVTYHSDGEIKSDCCPLNLQGMDSLPGTCALDLEKLNELLVTVNSIYLAECREELFDGRQTIKQALAKP